MISLIREYANAWVVKILLAMIVLVFIFFGINSIGSNKDEKIATVCGEPITKNNFLRVYNSSLENYRQSAGQPLTEAQIEEMQIQTRILQALINNKLLIAKAKELGITVSNKELEAMIHSIRAFHEDGIFNPNVYKRVLIANNLIAAKFENEQKEKLLTEKIKLLITDNVKVTEAELEEWGKWQNTEVNVDYIKFPIASYKANASKEEVKDFFEVKKEAYKTPPMVKIKYLYFSIDGIKKNINIKNDALKKYYENNQEEFYSPKSVEASHILFKVAQDADEKTVNKVKERAMKIYEKAIEKNADFAELAKKYSQGPTKDQGGFLGEFTKESMVEPFATTAFSLKEKEISKPIRTFYGWHIIKLNKIHKAKTTSFQDAKLQIKKQLVAEKKRELAFNKADKVFNSALDSDNLTEVAKELKLKLYVSKPLKIEGNKNVKIPADLIKTAFKMNEGDISDIKEFKDGFYIIQVAKKIPAEIPKLDEIFQTVEKDLVKQKQQEKAQESAENFLNNLLESDKSIESFAKGKNKKIYTSGFFKRFEAIPKIDANLPEATKSIFLLSKKDKITKKIFKINDSYYIFSLKDRKVPETSDDDKIKLKQYIISYKTQSIYNIWLNIIRMLKNKDIEVERNFI